MQDRILTSGAPLAGCQRNLLNLHPPERHQSEMPRLARQSPRVPGSSGKIRHWSNALLLCWWLRLVKSSPRSVKQSRLAPGCL